MSDVRYIASERRRAWEQRWGEQRGPDFTWHISEVPPELTELAESGRVAEGAALDLGCGTSVVMRYLAHFFRPAVGVDLAVGAVQQAAEFAAGAEMAPVFAVGDATALPFRESSFSLVFDRGCLQNVPPELWPAYWREVDRVLSRGGYLQLYCSRPACVLPALTTLKGVKARIRWIISPRKRKAFIQVERIRKWLPPSMKELDLREFPYRTSSGRMRSMVYGLVQKHSRLVFPAGPRSATSSCSGRSIAQTSKPRKKVAW